MQPMVNTNISTCGYQGKQRELIRPLRAVSARETAVERPWPHADGCSRRILTCFTSNWVGVLFRGGVRQLWVAESLHPSLGHSDMLVFLAYKASSLTRYQASGVASARAGWVPSMEGYPSPRR